MHGRVLGVASLSYGLGDVLIRVFLGSLLTSASDRVAVTDPTTGASNPERAAYAWRYVFYMSMVIACVLLVPSLLWLKNDPESVPELDGINTDGTLVEEQGADTVSKAKGIQCEWRMSSGIMPHHQRHIFTLYL